LDGTIFLNFAGESVIFGEKPGTCRIYSGDGSGSVRKEKEINLLHSKHWQPNPYNRRLQGITQPHLGTNMYAADRVKPPVPLKLDDGNTKPIEAP
jgi:hypothetical protein